MATIYKKRNIWYISVSIGNSRATRSLRTDNYKVAKSLKPHFESQLIAEVTGIKNKNEVLEFPELAERFLKADHSWAKNTYDLYRLALNRHLMGKPLPTNPTSRAIHIRHINACWNWGLKNNMIEKAYKIPGDTKGLSRIRTFTNDELYLMFDNIKDKSFNAFVRFAFYTGARSGEIRRISRVKLFSEYMIVEGKSGRRAVRLASQARKILDQNPEWNYSKDYVIKAWSRNRRRLGLKDVRMHDLRRTFGYNLIKQGRPIYEVSKLLGHSSVTTTERHYAPLMATEIEEFVL